MDDQRKDYADLKRRPKCNRTLNVPTDDVENSNGTNRGGGLLFAKTGIDPRKTERMP